MGKIREKLVGKGSSSRNERRKSHLLMLWWDWSWDYGLNIKFVYVIAQEINKFAKKVCKNQLPKKCIFLLSMEARRLVTSRLFVRFLVAFRLHSNTHSEGSPPRRPSKMRNCTRFFSSLWFVDRASEYSVLWAYYVPI